MIRFSLFGIPVEVQPFFWITLLILGGMGERGGGDNAAAIMSIAIFMLVGFVSILVHEFGHALTGRKLGGGYPRVVLHAFGGLAYCEGARLDKKGQFWMTAAGPGAGFLLLLLTLAVLAVFFGINDSKNLAILILFGVHHPEMFTARMIDFIGANPFIPEIISDLIWINFWWGVINLAPILPLDGGRILGTLLSPQRLVLMIGTITGVAMALTGWFVFGSLYMALMFGFLAWQNYKDMQQNRWQ